VQLLSLFALLVSHVFVASLDALDVAVQMLDFLLDMETTIQIWAETNSLDLLEEHQEDMDQEEEINSLDQLEEHQEVMDHIIKFYFLLKKRGESLDAPRPIPFTWRLRFQPRGPWGPA